MMGRVVEIAGEGRSLSLDRGFLVVEAKEERLGRVPLDEIGALIFGARGASVTSPLLAALVERGAPVVLVGTNHNPLAFLWPVQGHHLQGERVRLQTTMSQPLAKRLWQILVKAKIRMQAASLEAAGISGAALLAMAGRVRSGDPENLEAQAARRYWPLLLGEPFRRDRELGGVNALLNYGYAVLRAATARAVMAAGLHPIFALHHRNRSNAMALVDDLMEPFRPLVDLTVKRLAETGTGEVTPEAKTALAALTDLDLASATGTSPLSTCLERLVLSLVATLESGRPSLDLPEIPRPLDLAPPRSEEAAEPSGEVA